MPCDERSAQKPIYGYKYLSPSLSMEFSQILSVLFFFVPFYPYSNMLAAQNETSGYKSYPIPEYYALPD